MLGHWSKLLAHVRFARNRLAQGLKRTSIRKPQYLVELSGTKIAHFPSPPNHIEDEGFELFAAKAHASLRDESLFAHVSTLRLTRPESCDSQVLPAFAGVTKPGTIRQRLNIPAASVRCT